MSVQAANAAEAAEAWGWASVFGRGLPVTAQAALAYAYQRVNGRVSRDAYMLPALLSRDLTLTAAGQVQQTAMQLPTALLVLGLSARAYLDDTNDDTSMLSLSCQLPNLQGLLIGDPGFQFNVQLLAENATWLPLSLAWMLFPQDQTILQVQSSAALAGNATVSIGLQGAWIYGIM